jgi:hypothetical protein
MNIEITSAGSLLALPEERTTSIRSGAGNSITLSLRQLSDGEKRRWEDHLTKLYNHCGARSCVAAVTSTLVLLWLIVLIAPAGFVPDLFLIAVSVISIAVSAAMGQFVGEWINRKKLRLAIGHLYHIIQRRSHG